MIIGVMRRMALCLGSEYRVRRDFVSLIQLVFVGIVLDNIANFKITSM
jgi:hypothetical protein